MESLSQAFQHASLSDENEPLSTSHQPAPETNHQDDHIRVRSHLERDIIVFIDDSNVVSLEDLVMHIRRRRSNVESTALK